MRTSLIVPMFVDQLQLTWVCPKMWDHYPNVYIYIYIQICIYIYIIYIYIIYIIYIYHIYMIYIYMYIIYCTFNRKKK